MKAEIIRPQLCDFSQELSIDFSVSRANYTFFVGNLQIVMPEYVGVPQPIEFHEQKCIEMIKDIASKL